MKVLLSLCFLSLFTYHVDKSQCYVEASSERVEALSEEGLEVESEFSVLLLLDSTFYNFKFLYTSLSRRYLLEVNFVLEQTKHISNRSQAPPSLV